MDLPRLVMDCLPSGDFLEPTPPSVHPFDFLKFRPGAIVVEFLQDILGQLKPEIPRTAHIGDRLDLGAGHLPGLLEGLFAKMLSLQEGLGLPQTNHGGCHAGVGNPGPSNDWSRFLDPDAGTERSYVEVVASGYLVKFQFLISNRQRNGDAGNQLIGSQDSRFVAGVEIIDPDAPTAPLANHFQLGVGDEEEWEGVGNRRTMSNIGYQRCDIPNLR